MRNSEGNMRTTRLAAIAVIIAIAVGAGCGEHRPAAPTDYMAWVNAPESGLVCGDSVGGLVLTLRLLPTEYLLARDRSGTGHGRADTNAMKAAYDSCLYFVMTVAPNMRSAARPDADRTQRPEGGLTELEQAALSGELRTRFGMRGAGGSADAVAAWAEPAYDAGAGEHIMIVFPRHGVLAAETGIVAGTVEVLMRTAADTARFRFRAEDIARRPEL